MFYLNIRNIWGCGRRDIYSTFAAAVRSTPQSASLPCGVLLPIRQPFGGESFFIFYRSGVGSHKPISGFEDFKFLGDFTKVLFINQFIKARRVDMIIEKGDYP